MDDDDEFLYGDSELKESSLAKVPSTVITVPVPSAVEPDDIPFGKAESADDDLFPLIRPAEVTVSQTNDNERVEGDADVDADVDVGVGVNADEDADADADADADVDVDVDVDIQADADAYAATEDGSEAADESDEDIEFIMEPTNRSLDLRSSKPVARNASSSTPQRVPPGPTLTTEYTPRERGGPAKPPTAQSSTSVPVSWPPTSSNTIAPSAAAAAAASPTPDVKSRAEDGHDPTTLPPVIAPPSHPAIDPTVTGILEGRPVFEVDMTALADKAWRRPGSDISDWFNYGFDEISWEAYCYRRRELGDLAAVLKTNVVNFSGMPEDQLTQLPPEIRTMVMTGAAAMMANGGAPMMQPGINPMMGPEMGTMNMGPQMMMAGMGGEMGMDAVGVGVGAPQQGQGGPMPDQLGAAVEGFGPQSGIGVGMGLPEYGIQDPGGMQQMQQQQQQQLQQQQQQLQQQQMQPQQLQQQQMQQQQLQQQQHMFQNMEAPVAPSPPVGPSRGVAQGPFRGPRGMMIRGGRGGYMARGRGAHPTPPARPASPLPPNVPTGPRNQNKYKDRDNNAQAVDGLDYGGGVGVASFGGADRGSGTPGVDHDDRGGRKRRDRSPIDDRRDPKRR